MTGIHEAARFAIEASVAFDEWDEMPMLFVLFENDELALFSFSGLHPVEFMGRLANGEFNDQVPEGTVSGVALLTESWGFEDPRPELVEWAQTKSIADHPEGVEMKMAVSYDGLAVIGTMFSRGSEKPRSMGDGEGLMSGRVPDVVKRAFATLNAR